MESLHKPLGPVRRTARRHRRILVAGDREDVNVSLRAVHDALVRGPGDPAHRWRSVIEWLAAHTDADRFVDAETMRTCLRAVGAAGAASDWCANLRQLGVLYDDGRLDPERAQAVATALELVGDSFATLAESSSWALVATLPAELRALLKPTPMRHTAGVLLELLDRARHDLLVAMPFIDSDAVHFLRAALLGAGRRGAAASVVTSVGHANCFCDVARTWEFEATAPLRVTEVHTQISWLGSHAKVLVADGERAYVGSANLTAAGLGRHLEIGVELTGAQVADLATIVLALERLGTPVIEVAAAAR